MASFVYNYYKYRQMGFASNLATNWIDHTIKVALVGATYTPSQDNHDFLNDVTEVTGTGYSAGGATLASKTLTQDNTNNWAIADAGNSSWNSSSISASGAVIYRFVTAASDSPLICYIDFGATYTSVASTFQIVWSTSPSGILYLS